jgi:hypothetical protein
MIPIIPLATKVVVQGMVQVVVAGKESASHHNSEKNQFYLRLWSLPIQAVIQKQRNERTLNEAVGCGIEISGIKIVERGIVIARESGSNHPKTFRRCYRLH